MPCYVDRELVLLASRLVEPGRQRDLDSIPEVELQALLRRVEDGHDRRVGVLE